MLTVYIQSSDRPGAQDLVPMTCTEAAHDGRRPASVRRIGKMKELVAELARRDMDRADVMRLLDCSMSSARIYIGELLCAGVVIEPPCGRHRAGGDRIMYRIVPDPGLIHGFLAAVAAAAPEVDAAASLATGGRRVHILADDVAYPLILSDAKVLRDPLVAALFGKLTR